MSESHHELIRELFLRALELPTADRPGFVSAEAGDAAVRAEVFELLEEHGRSGTFLDAHSPGDSLREELKRRLEVAEPVLPKSIGDYRVLGLLGEGGMGTVFEAEQRVPRRRVALKVLRSDFVSGDGQERFRREAELLGRLQHPGIAQIFEAGTAPVDGGAPRAFVAMELVRGDRLDEHASGLDRRELLELFVKICEAVQHAHDRGVVHRDLKPANILVDQRGQPRILDFGVARAADGAGPVRTRTGQLVGTLAYMAPEQARGGGPAVDARADVHALGVMLYEALSGRSPRNLADASLHEGARRLVEELPLRLGSIDRSLRGDLEVVVGKALERDPGRRYATATALADDLRRLLLDEPVRARPPGLVRVVSRFTRRHRVLVSAALLVIAALATGALIAWGQARIARESARRARAQSYRAQVGAAAAALATGNAGAVRRHLAEAPSEHRGWEWRHLAARSDTSAASWSTNGLPPRVLVFSADGKSLWCQTARTQAIAWDFATGEPRPPGWIDLGAARPVTVPEPFARVALRYWQFAEGERSFELRSAETGQALLQVHRCGEGRQLRGVFGEGWVGVLGGRLCDLSTGRIVAQLPPFRRAIGVVVIGGSDDGLVARSGLRGELDVHRKDGSLLFSRVQEEPMLSLALAGSAEVLLAASGRGLLKTWDLSDGSLRGLRRPQAGQPIRAVALDARASLAAVGYGNGRIRIFDGHLGEELADLIGHEASVEQLTFSPDGRFLVSADLGGELRSWDLSQASEEALRGHGSYVYDLAMDATGARLASAAWDGSVRIWDPARARLLRSVRTPDGGNARFRLVTMSPDGRRVTASASFGPLLDWDAEKPGSVRWLAAPARLDGRLEDLAWSPDGQRLAIAATRGVAVGSGEPGGWSVQRSAVSRFTVWSSDGSRLVASEGGQPVWLESQGLGELARFDWQGEALLALALSNDDRLLAGVTNQGRLAVWDAGTGQLLVTREAHPGRAFAVVFHPSEPRLFTGGDDGLVRVWDTDNWTELVQLSGHSSYVHALAISGDGGLLASASGDGTLRLWRAP